MSIIFVVLNTVIFSVKASDPSDLNYLVLKCYKTRESKDCVTALTFLESLQIDAYNRNDYRCQTASLGMSSELILILLRNNIDEPNMQLFRLNEICKYY